MCEDLIRLGLTERKSKTILLSLKDNLKKYGIMGGSLVHKVRGYDLKYSVRDSFILYKIMYNINCSLFLRRKKEKFESYMRMRS